MWFGCYVVVCVLVVVWGLFGVIVLVWFVWWMLWLGCGELLCWLAVSSWLDVLSFKVLGRLV